MLSATDAWKSDECTDNLAKEQELQQEQQISELRSENERLCDELKLAQECIKSLDNAKNEMQDKLNTAIDSKIRAVQNASNEITRLTQLLNNESKQICKNCQMYVEIDKFSKISEAVNALSAESPFSRATLYTMIKELQSINNNINLIDDINPRSDLDVGSLCQVYSRSNNKWYDAKIRKRFIDSITNEEWLIVKYGDNKIKKIQRLCKDLRVDSVYDDEIIDIAEKQIDIEQKSITNMNKATEFSWNEIIKHNKKTDLWLVYDNKVFDITSFLRFHPGGIEVILDISAKSQDVTRIFAKLKHPPIADRIIARHYIGNVCNETAYKQMSMDLTAIKPIWENDNLKVNNVNSMQHQYQQHCQMKMQCILSWTDIYSVKIAVIDRQHQNLMNLINDIFNFYEVKYLLEFLKRWEVHCKTEETLFEYYNFDETTALNHMVAHKEIYHFVKDQVTGIRIKYNGQQPQCKELIDFSKKMGVKFKDHHFEFDTKYIDHLDEPILNDL